MEDTCYVTVQLYGPLCRKYQDLHRGMNVRVEGQLKYLKWTDKDTGKTRSNLVVVADDIELLDDCSDHHQERPDEYDAAGDDSWTERYSGPDGEYNLMSDIGFDDPELYSAWLESR